jgi:hypothetical protein
MNLPGWDWKENILNEEFPHGVYIAVRVSKHLK